MICLGSGFLFFLLVAWLYGYRKWRDRPPTLTPIRIPDQRDIGRRLRNVVAQ